MPCNSGGMERIIRGVLGIVLVLAWLLHWVLGTFGLILGILGLVFVVTAAIGFCPIFAVMGISTCKTKK